MSPKTEALLMVISTIAGVASAYLAYRQHRIDKLCQGTTDHREKPEQWSTDKKVAAAFIPIGSGSIALGISRMADGKELNLYLLLGAIILYCGISIFIKE